VAIAENEICTNQGFKNFIFSNEIDPSFAYYYLRSIRDIAEAMGTGTTFKEISGAASKLLPFVIAPLAEQKVIADKLDALLAQVDTLKARLDAIPAILKRFRQSVLSAAVTGKLTEEWRKVHSQKNELFNFHISDKARKGLHSNWGSAPLGHVARFIDYRGKTPIKTDSGIPLITAKNVRQGYVSMDPKEFIAETDYESWMTRGIPKSGDVLITTEAPLGYVAEIDWEFKFALAQRIICLQFNERVLGAFAAIAMQANEFQEILMEQSTGTTVSGIKAARLKEIEISIPPIAEQTEIVRCVKSLFDFTNQIEARVQEANSRVKHLTQSILAKAFRGELTEEWRKAHPELVSGQNSAEALLERIRVARAAAPETKGKRGRPVRDEKVLVSTYSKQFRTHIRSGESRMSKSRSDEDVNGKAYLAGCIASLGGQATIEALFQASDLDLPDFYKQLAWEVNQGLIRDLKTMFEVV